jgi:hypothetical protein
MEKRRPGEEYDDVFGDGHSTKFKYCMGVMKFGKISWERVAPIRPFDCFAI